MKNLFVEKSIKINAPAFRIWEVLTEPSLTKEWVKTWWPEIVIVESDWKLGSLVIWKIAGGTIGSEGNVLEANPHTLLKFGFKVNDPTFFRQEIITYTLEEIDEHTKFTVTVGDFGDTPEHQQCYHGAMESWNRSLPKIKELAEHNYL